MEGVCGRWTFTSVHLALPHAPRTPTHNTRHVSLTRSICVRTPTLFRTTQAYEDAQYIPYAGPSAQPELEPAGYHSLEYHQLAMGLDDEIRQLVGGELRLSACGWVWPLCVQSRRRGWRWWWLWWWWWYVCVFDGVFLWEDGSGHAAHAVTRSTRSPLVLALLLPLFRKRRTAEVEAPVQHQQELPPPPLRATLAPTPSRSRQNHEVTPKWHRLHAPKHHEVAATRVRRQQGLVGDSTVLVRWRRQQRHRQREQ
jgi:hypothetical protein